MSGNSNEVLETVYELSKLLNTGLDRETLVILMSLIQKGVNPEALATVVKDLRKEVASSSTIRSTSTSSPRTGATSTSTTAATTIHRHANVMGTAMEVDEEEFGQERNFEY